MPEITIVRPPGSPLREVLDRAERIAREMVDAEAINAEQEGAKAERDRIVTWLREYASPVEIAGTILPSSNVAQSIANMIEEGQHHV